jgi:hypothetical protein
MPQRRAEKKRQKKFIINFKNKLIKLIKMTTLLYVAILMQEWAIDHFQEWLVNLENNM